MRSSGSSLASKQNRAHREGGPVFLFVISALGIFVHRDGDAELHHLVEVVDGVFHVLRNGSLRERLEIEQAGVAPPFCVAGLDAELALYLAEALGIDIGLEGVPDGEEAAGLTDTVVIFVAELTRGLAVI